MDGTGPTRPLAAKNMQLMTEGEVLQFQNRPAAQSAGDQGDDPTREFIHAADITEANPKTLYFSALSEFLVATGRRADSRD